MKKITLFLLFTLSVNANSISNLANELKLSPGSKASIQWNRVFSSERRLKRYNLDSLSKTTLYALKEYLINHAADSDQPIVPGL